jgi:hypothetical protein
MITNKDDVDKRINSINNRYSKFNTVFQCSVGIINIIIIPLVSTSFLSSNCFYYSIIPQPILSSSYIYQELVNSCNIFGQCDNEIESVTRTSAYQPPFEYSYQCASTLMTTYDSVYIYMSILLISEPLLVTFIKFWYRKVKEYERIEKIINKFLPSTLKPLQSSLTNSIKEDKGEEKEIKEGNIFMKCYKKFKKHRMKTILFNQTNFIVDIVIFIVLSVTVGFILPLVGIITCISLYLYIHSTLSNIGGKLTNATTNEKEILEKESIKYMKYLKYLVMIHAKQVTKVGEVSKI